MIESAVATAIGLYGGTALIWKLWITAALGQVALWLAFYIQMQRMRTIESRLEGREER